MRKQTKAQIILAEAKARVDKAQMDLDSHQKQLEMALAVLQAHRAAFYDLERSLAPKSRSNGKSPSSAADKRRAKMICVDCHLPSADRIHTDASNSAHHPFVLDRDESPPTAPSAGKKSSSGKQQKLAGVASIADETVNAMSASNATANET